MNHADVFISSLPFIGFDLCISYSIDPREFVEIFMAFSINHLNGAEPTESTLDDFERKELANYKVKKSNTNVKLQQSFNECDEIGSDEEDNDVLGAYICTTPKVSDDFECCFVKILKYY